MFLLPFRVINFSLHVIVIFLKKSTNFTLPLSLLLLPSLVLAIQVDVSGQVNVSRIDSGLESDRENGSYTSHLTLKNSLMPIGEPLWVVIDSISTNNIILENADGKTDDGKPYVAVPLNSQLNPGDVVKDVLLRFGNPKNEQISFTTKILANVTSVLTPTTALTVVDSKGGTVELPGVAAIQILPNTTNSAAIQISQIDSAIVDKFVNNIEGISALDEKTLSIKSSSKLLQPIYITVPVKDGNGYLSSGSVFQFVSVFEGDNDTESDQADYSSIYIAAEPCQKNNFVCATLPPYLFSDNPLDPSDPVILIRLVVASPENAVEKIIKKFIKTSDVTPSTATSNVDQKHPVVFGSKISIDLPEEFRYAALTPLAKLMVNEGFMIKRSVQKRRHLGIDLKATLKTDVFSVKAGKVAQAGQETTMATCTKGYKPQSYYSNTMFVAHPKDKPVFYSSYRHLEEFETETNKEVGTADKIALSGDTGTCSPHLHFETSLTKPNGLKVVNAIDPRPILWADMSQFLLPPDEKDLESTNSTDYYNGAIFRLNLNIGNASSSQIVESLTELNFIQLIGGARTNLSWWPANGGVNLVGASDDVGTTLPTADPNKSTISLIRHSVEGKIKAVIDYNSGPVSLGEKLQKYTKNMSLSDFTKLNDVNVTLEMCTFRLLACHTLNKWEIKINPDFNFSNNYWVGSAVIQECSEIQNYSSGCNYLSYNHNVGNGANIAFRSSDEPLNMRIDQQYGCIGIDAGALDTAGSSFSYSLQPVGYNEFLDSATKFTVERADANSISGSFSISFNLLGFNGKQGTGTAKGIWSAAKADHIFPKCLRPAWVEGIPTGGQTYPFFCPSLGDYWGCDYRPLSGEPRDGEWLP